MLKQVEQRLGRAIDLCAVDEWFGGIAWLRVAG
jgi:hypothetical protein